MATYADLQARIIRETNRDDLGDTLALSLTQAIQDAIAFYADQRFWFNESIATSVTVLNNEYVSLPGTTNFRKLDRFAITVGATQYPLRAQSLVQIEDWAKAIQTQGQPTDYAVYGSADTPTYRLWPRPNAVFPLTWVGVVDLGTLSAGSDSNSWTTYGQALIVARAKMLLYRDQFRDMEGAQVAANAEAQQLNTLKTETARRLGTGRMKSSW
jgi:hypothetical protein